MNKFIENFTSSKKLMKILMKYMDFFQEGSMLSYFLLLIKYIPLIIITHDWKLTKHGGLYPLIGKLTITNYLNYETSEIFSNIFVYFFLAIYYCFIIFFFFCYIKLNNFDIRVKKYKSYMLKVIFILSFLNFFCAQIYYELLSFLILKNWSVSKTDPTQYTSSIITRLIAIFIGGFTFMLVLCLNVFFDLINFRPYYIKTTYFANEINNISYNNIIFPLLKIILVAEIFLNFQPILIIKIILRVLFIFSFLNSIYHFHLKIYYLELFIASLCFVSCIIEFIFIKDFFSISQADISLLILKPQDFSEMYVHIFFYTKIFLQFFLAGIICLIVKLYDNNFIINFFKNIKENKFYCFYNKNYEFLKSLKNDEINTDVLSSICKNINLHIEKCTNSDCLCVEYKNNLSKDNHFDTKVFLKNFIFILEKNLKANLKRTKYSNSENYVKYLMVETIYSLYFKKHYAKCFFNLEKIQQQSYCKKNFFLKIQIFLLKYEVIVDFIKFNKSSPNSVFKKMRENYEKYNKYKDLETNFLKIFSDYKNLISIFYAKNITFSEFYHFLEKLFKSINTGNTLINYLLTNHDKHNSTHIRKIDYISNFLNGENIYIPAHKLSNFLLKNYDDQTEKIIIKHTKKKEFLIDYISSKMAEQMSLKTDDIVGNDIHKFMAGQFIEFHYSHIVKHIKENQLLIKNKEIYFVDKHGYSMNYYVDGSILITLSGDILVYIEATAVCEEYKQNNVSFISCDEEGEIIALNKTFADNFYIDIHVKNIVQPNLFKNILTFNKSYLQSKKKKINLKYSYDKMLKNIRGIDYSKLWDYNTSAYFKYLENLNINKHTNPKQIFLNLEIYKRNLQEKFFFYDIKIVLTYSSEETNFLKSFQNIPILSNILTAHFNPDNNSPKKKSTKKDLFRINKTINKIRTMSTILRKIGFVKKPKEIKTQEVQEIKNMRKKYSELDIEKHDNLNHRNSFIRMGIFILFILGFFIFLGNFSSNVFSQVEILSKMKLNVLYLQQINYNIINSVFSINLVTGNIQPSKIIQKNLNYSTILDNSNLYHMKVLEKRRDFYQETFHNFYNLYLSLDIYLMSNIAGIFNLEMPINNLNNDWSSLTSQIKIFDVLEYNYRGVSKILGDNTSQNKFLVYDKNSNFFYKKPSNLSTSSINLFENPSIRDKNIYYFLENSLVGFKNSYDKLKSSFDHFFTTATSSYKTEILILFLVIGIIVIVFFIYEGINFYKNYQKVFSKYFVLFDIIKHYNDELFIKIELLEELFLDFTELNREKYYKLTSDDIFMQKKLSRSETLKESYTEIKQKITLLTENKNSNRYSFINKSSKSNRLLDYYETKTLNENNDKNNNGNSNIEPNRRKLSNNQTIENNNKLSKNTKINKKSTIEEIDENQNDSKNNNLDNSNKIEKNTQEDLNNIESASNLKTQNGKDLKVKHNDNYMVYLNSSVNIENLNNNYINSTITKNLNFQEIEDPISSTQIKKNLKKKTINLSSKTSFNVDFNKGKTKTNLSTYKDKINTLSSSSKENLAKNNNISTISTINKTDGNFLNNRNSSTKDEDFPNHLVDEEDNISVKKSKSFYLIFILFWVMMVLIISLIIVNIDNTTKRFEKIKLFDSNSVLFYKRILIFSEILLIFQISAFKKNSTFLIKNSKIFLEKLNLDYIENEKLFQILHSDNFPILEDLRLLEETLDEKDHFCTFLAENIYKTITSSNKAQIITDYTNECQRISQNFFSKGFTQAMDNLFNYISQSNKDLVNYFTTLKLTNEEFPDKKIESYLNDNYYVFSFVNHDRIISDVYNALDYYIKVLQEIQSTSMENFSNFIFYFLYVFIILLGIFSIYKTKYLIGDSDRLINQSTSII